MVYIFVDLKANFSTAQHPKVKMGQRVVGGGGGSFCSMVKII